MAEPPRTAPAEATPPAPAAKALGTLAARAEARFRAVVAGLLGEAPEWQESALCAQTDPEAFYPGRGTSTQDAKRICRLCDVRTDCLEYALGNSERYGVWGGLSEPERRKLKRGGMTIAQWDAAQLLKKRRRAPKQSAEQ